MARLLFVWNLPASIYRGVFVSGKAYTCGDVVAWNGSLWVKTNG